MTWVAIGPATSPPKQPVQRSSVDGDRDLGVLRRREADEPRAG